MNIIITRQSAKKTMREVKRHWQLYVLFILPFMFLLVFRYWPIIGSQIAFRQYNFKDGVWGSPWVGLKNFKMFFNSPQFSILLKNTLGLSFYNIFAGVLPPIILAIAIHYATPKIFGKSIQMLTYMPYFISTVLVIGILNQILGLNGPVNQWIISNGGTAIHFTGSARLFKTVYVFSGIWQTCGYSAVIYLSALSAVDQELHEAARVDGANIWKRIRYIDIPSITPTAVILLIMACGHVLTIGYEKALIMQNTLNMTSSSIIPTYVYQIGIESMNYSYATAIGLFQSVVSLLLLLVVNRIAKYLGEASLW